MYAGSWLLQIDYPQMVKDHYEKFASCDYPPPCDVVSICFSVVEDSGHEITIFPFGMSVKWTLVMEDDRGYGISQYIRDGYAKMIPYGCQ